MTTENIVMSMGANKQPVSLRQESRVGSIKAGVIDFVAGSLGMRLS